MLIDHIKNKFLFKNSWMLKQVLWISNSQFWYFNWSTYPVIIMSKLMSSGILSATNMQIYLDQCRSLINYTYRTSIPIVPVKLCWETGTGGVGRPRPSRVVSRFRRTWAMVSWSELLAKTSNRLSNNCLQCWWTKGRLWSMPNNAMCSINGMWIDQSISSESDGKSFSNMTAMLHLKI